MKDGHQPTVFEIGVIPPAELNRIEDETSGLSGELRLRERGWRCFIASLRGVQNFDAEEINNGIL
jgi:hypothetical protein